MLTRYIFLRFLAEIEWGWLRDTIGLIAGFYFFLFGVFCYLPVPPIAPVRVSYPPMQNFTPDHLMAFELIWPQLPTNMEATERVSMQTIPLVNTFTPQMEEDTPDNRRHT